MFYFLSYLECTSPHWVGNSHISYLVLVPESSFGVFPFSGLNKRFITKHFLMKFQGFLHIDEYPPDANQGFDIPSALVSFPEFNSARNYPELGSPLLENFQVNPSGVS